jgi:hypothetical protein
MTKPTPPSQKNRKQVKVGALSYAQLVLHMLEGVHTCQELAELTGLHYVTVLQYTRELHAAGAAHICAWEKDIRGRDSIKVYKIGKGRNAKRERMTPAQRAMRYRAKAAHLAMINVMAGGAA